MTHLYHLVHWDGFCLETYTPDSLASEGFVHLSSADQVLRTANRWFKDAGDLGLLVLETKSLGSNLRWEDLYDRGEEFPHLYSPIPPESVLSIARLRRGPEGDYLWPFSALLDPLDNGPALIEPSRRFPEAKLPETCVLCFFEEVLESLEGPWLEGLGSEIGARRVRVLDDQVVCFPGIGGPVAAATLEELIALGCRRFVCCGGAGSLQPELQLGHLVLVDRALRDEGLSHHYLSPDTWVEADADLLARGQHVLNSSGVPFQVGASWTTDALYRETPDRIARRKAQGCLTVEMEAAALMAVAQFRQVPLICLLYCGDDVSSDTWDFRDWTSAQTVRERLFWLAHQI